MIATTLKDRIRQQIRLDGPLSVSVFMQLALHDRTHGYYATRPGLMKDFATAPEISQVFGELIGAWVAHEWARMGSPDPFDLIEIGPGRGVMMADALRVAAHDPAFANALRVTLVEPAPALQQVQAQRLSDHAPDFVANLEDMSPAPAIIIANEWLDCLPIRQFVKDRDQWRERVVGLDDKDELAFGLTPPIGDLPAAPPDGQDQWEYSPALDAMIDRLAKRLRTHPGRVLLIDYGPVRSAPADTLRAYSNGAQVSPLDDPGAADMTADVDFSALVHSANKHGLDVAGPVPQGLFLKALGIETRVNQLMTANPAQADAIAAAAMRIAAPDDMGTRFNVVCLSSPGLVAPVGF